MSSLGAMQTMGEGSCIQCGRSHAHHGPGGGVMHAGRYCSARFIGINCGLAFELQDTVLIVLTVHVHIHNVMQISNLIAIYSVGPGQLLAGLTVA